MVNKNKFKTVNTGLAWVLYYNKLEIGRYRTKKAASIDQRLFIERYGM